VFRHLGRGRWTTSARLASLPNNWLGVRLADLDGDGQLDAVGLATAGGLPGVNVYMRRPPALEFQWLQPGIAISLASDMELGDVDGDGDVDAVVASAQGTLLLANPGDGALSAPIPVPGVPPSATSICELSDLDGDGDDDLVLGPLSACVQVLWNDGAGTFTAGPCLPLPGTGVRAATVADLDADGRLDVAFVARPDLVMWYRQLPGGTFAAGPSPAPVGFDPEQLLAADIDDDGDADLLLAGDPALALRNDGNGVFTGDPSALPTGRTGNLVAIDLDEDGDADLVGSRSGSVAAVVLENRARSARSGHVPRVGGSLAVEFLVAAGAASPGALLIPGGTFDIVPGIEVPSVLGTLLLGPAPLQLPWVPIAVPAGSGTLLTAVPPAPELAGVHVSVQGLAFSQAFGLGFTNVVDERIRP
jgi:hypothetical protein